MGSNKRSLSLCGVFKKIQLASNRGFRREGADGAVAQFLLALVVCAFIGLGCEHSGDTNARLHRRCQSQLGEIAAAVRQYRSDHGVLPLFGREETGDPEVAWTTYLLPYLGRDSAHRAYVFNEDWNSPKNLEVALELQTVLTCGLDSARQQRSYFLLGEISDAELSAAEGGKVVEIHESGVQLLEPVSTEKMKILMMKYQQNMHIHGEEGW